MASYIVTQRDRDKFFAHTHRNNLTGCLEWRGATFHDGYGAIRVAGGARRAPRVAWMIANGDIPDDAHVLHSCDNPSCVEISHLRLGDPAANTADKIARGRSPMGDSHWSRRMPDRIARGERAGLAKLTEDNVRAIRNLAGGGIPVARIAVAFGISVSQADRIVKRQRWGHVK